MKKIDQSRIRKFVDEAETSRAIERDSFSRVQKLREEGLELESRLRTITRNASFVTYPDQRFGDMPMRGDQPTIEVEKTRDPTAAESLQAEINQHTALQEDARKIYDQKSSAAKNALQLARACIEYARSKNSLPADLAKWQG